MGRLSPEKKAIIKISIWTTFIIGALSVGNFLFIISRVGPGIDMPFQRELASVPKKKTFTPDMTSPLVELDCQIKTPKKAIVTKAPTARLLFKNCKKVINIVNESNRNQGDVFPLPKKQWTSDFIFLSPGENKLSWSVDGQVHTLEITRENTASTQDQKAL